MALKNQPLIVNYFAGEGGAPVTGDAANHTLAASGDGVRFAPAAKPVEVDPAGMPGVYSVSLAAGEMNYNSIALGGKSSTQNVTIIPQFLYTERGVLPAVAPGSAGGLPVLNASAILPAMLSPGQSIAAEVNGLTVTLTTAAVAPSK